MGLPRRYTTGPVERDPATSQLRIKLSNEDPDSAHTARVTVFRLDGSKVGIFEEAFALPARTSHFVEVDLPALHQFEVEITVSDWDVYVAVFGYDTANDRVVAANAIPFGDMVRVPFPL